MSKYPIFITYTDSTPTGFQEFPFNLPEADGTNGQVLVTDGSGTLTFASQSSPGDITTDSAWAAAGDLIVGTGNDTASILSKGTTGYYLKAAADGLEWATVSSGGGGITWTEVTGTSGNAAADNGYICNNANLVTITLPSTIAVGKTIRIAGNGAGGWKLAQNASQVIYFGDQNTTTGTGGYLASVNRYDSIEIICITADTTFNVIGSMGDITVV